MWLFGVSGMARWVTGRTVTLVASKYVGLAGVPLIDDGALTEFDGALQGAERSSEVALTHRKCA